MANLSRHRKEDIKYLRDALKTTPPSKAKELLDLLATALSFRDFKKVQESLISYDPKTREQKVIDSARGIGTNYVIQRRTTYQKGSERIKIAMLYLGGVSFMNDRGSLVLVRTNRRGAIAKPILREENYLSILAEKIRGGTLEQRMRHTVDELEEILSKSIIGIGYTEVTTEDGKKRIRYKSYYLHPGDIGELVPMP